MGHKDVRSHVSWSHNVYNDRYVDLIIDDGLHSIFTNLNTILNSLPKLNKKGWLIIEDIGAEKIDKKEKIVNK